MAASLIVLVGPIYGWAYLRLLCFTISKCVLLIKHVFCNKIGNAFINMAVAQLSQ